MYKVVKMFDDLQDSTNTKSGTVYHRYEVGDVYPRQGLKPSAARIKELSGSGNLQETPLIVEVKERAKRATKKA